MKKLGVFADTHGNFLALKTVVEYFESIACEEILHLGDIVDIGPFSRECFDYIVSKNITCVIGNHDRDFVLNHPQVRQLSHVPTEHKEHVFATLTESHRVLAKNFPLYVTRNCGGKRLMFCHYPFDLANAQNHLEQFVYMPIEHNQTAQNFDQMMKDYPFDGVFFGHKHELADALGERTYVNVGSVGCHPKPFAQGLVIEYDDNTWNYTRVSIPYDMQQVHRDMQRLVPYGEQLYDFYFLRVLK